VDYGRLQQLSKLILPDNHISDAGVTHLINAMENLGPLGQLPFEDLGTLNLSGNQVGDEVMVRLFDAVIEREKLEGGVNVQGNPSKSFVLQAVEERQLNPQVVRLLETLSQSK
jgi:hypothetical protein